MKSVLLHLTLCAVIASTAITSLAQTIGGEKSNSVQGVTGYAKFGYRERTATGISSTQLAQVSLYLPERMEVHIRADTSATCLQTSGTTFAIGFSLDQLPASAKDPMWPESARFTTIPQAKQWMPCASTYVVELEQGDHTIYWYAGDVHGGPVIFDAGVMSVQGFPVSFRSPGQGSQKLALLVGINEYQRVSGLKGCENDVNDMKDLLINRFGFREEDILILLNKDATYDAIPKAFRDHLIAKSGSGTIAVFYYSGHGSLQKDEVGGDEKDGYDETIVAHDSRTRERPNDISDDKINKLFTDLSGKTSYVTFVFDSCHSGTITKARGTLARFVEPNQTTPTPDTDNLPASGIISYSGDNYVLISGCTAKEVSYEYRVGGRNRGTMTYFLTRAIRSSIDSRLTYRDVMTKVADNVSAVYPTQHPQIEGGNADLPVFRIHTQPIKDFLLVSPDGDSIVVAAGEVQGMTIGSHFDVFAPLGSDLSDSRKRLATIELISVDPFFSLARRVSGGAFPKSSRAVESHHVYPANRFSVFFDVEGLSRQTSVPSPVKLKRLREELPSEQFFKSYFQQTSDWGDAQLIFSENSDGDIEISDGIYTLEVGVNAVSTDLILQKLQHWAKWLKVVQFKNEGPSQLPVKFDIVERQRAIALPVSPWKSERSFLDGDPIVASMTNDSDAEAFVTVIDCSSNGKVQIVAPVPKADGSVSFISLQSGETRNLAIGTARLSGEAGRIRDVLKFIATDQPIDVQSLTLGETPKSASFAATIFGDMLFSSEQKSAASLKVNAWTTRTVTVDVVQP